MAVKEQCECGVHITATQMGAHKASKKHATLMETSVNGRAKTAPPTTDTLPAGAFAQDGDRQVEPPDKLDEENEDDIERFATGGKGKGAGVHDKGDAQAQADHRDREIPQQHLEIKDAPPPFGDYDETQRRPEAVFIDPTKPAAKRPTPAQMGDGAQPWDELDVLIGAPPSQRENGIVFDWAKDRLGRRLTFSRYYHTRGVLIDRFASITQAVRLEVGEKIDAITRYNEAQEDKAMRLGYIPTQLGTPITITQADRALRHEIVETIIEPLATDPQLRGRTVDMSAQTL